MHPTAQRSRGVEYSLCPSSNSVGRSAVVHGEKEERREKTGRREEKRERKTEGRGEGERTEGRRERGREAIRSRK